MTLSLATVAPAFISDSTHPRYGSSLALAGLHHRNEHLCDHMFITILLTAALLSSRPGWNRRWCYHRQVPKPLCESHRNLGTSPHGAIRHKPASYGCIHKRALSGHKSLNSTSFCPLSRPWSRHFALSRVPYRPYAGQSASFQLNATVRGVFMPDTTLEFLPIFSRSKCTKSSIFSDFPHSWQSSAPRKLPRCFQA